MGTTLRQARRPDPETTEDATTDAFDAPEQPSEVFRIKVGPRASDVEFALRDARNMLALLAANVEVLGQPADPRTEMVTDDIRDGTRRLGNLLAVIAELLRPAE
jgi:hypothetical protein